MGDRLQETANGQTTTFLMDYNTGLTQVLNDGTNTYIYGNGRIAQANGAGTEYFLGDALGSVRQLTNTSGAVTYASAYDPYGVTTQTYGDSGSAYGYTGEYTDSYIKLIYLRSRMYDPASGRFTTRDSWQGDYNRPLSLNRWAYVEGNPANYTDPTGHFSPEAIWRYLLYYYGGDEKEAHEVMQSWMDDQDWWDMISKAKAGDVLIVGETLYGTQDISSPRPIAGAYTFDGQGNDVLIGITPKPGYGYLSEGSDSSTIFDIQRGDRVIGHSLSGNNMGIDYDWVGFYRTDSRGKPYFEIQPDYQWRQRTWQPWATTITDGVAGGVISGPINFPWSYIIGVVGFSFVPGASDVLNMQGQDVNVQFWRKNFSCLTIDLNFQIDAATDTWTLEP